MNHIKRSLQTMALFLAALLAIVGSGSYAKQTLSQPDSAIAGSNNNQRVRFNPPQASEEDESDFDDDGRPINRRPGSDRDYCPVVDLPLTALIPERDHLVLTTVRDPAFLFYFPYNIENVKGLEFVLQNSEGDDIYRKSLELAQRPGVIKIKLPSEPKNNIDIGEQYHWFFKVYCDSQDTSQYVFVEGWVKRIAIDTQLQEQLVADESRKYFAYADRGIWYDAMENIAELRLREPDNSELQKDWAVLLESVKLSELAQEPLVDCCVVD